MLSSLIENEKWLRYQYAIKYILQVERKMCSVHMLRRLCKWYWYNLKYHHSIVYYFCGKTNMLMVL